MTYDEARAVFLDRYGSDPAPLMIKTGDTESDYEVVDHKDYIGVVDAAQRWREAGDRRKSHDLLSENR